MENKGERHAQGVKQTLETMIGADLSLKRKKKSEHDLSKELFEKIIIALEKANVRTTLMMSEFQADLSKYDEVFYEIIDNLLLMNFGKEACEVIFYYVYERINPDGSFNELRDLSGQSIVLQNPNDLWELVQHIRNKKK